jgi:hypothetical protein
MGMGVTRHPYDGIRGMRYEFLREHDPELVRRMNHADTMGPYLDEVERRYRARLSELFPICMERCGATREVAQRDMEQYLRNGEAGRRMAFEIARHEIIEAL